MAPPVTVIGDALLDVHVTPAEPMRPGGDVPASIRLEPGGQGANLAVRLARRGIEVRLVCATGEDAAGEIVRRALAQDGVELVDVGADATGIVVVLLDRERDRTMLSRRAPLAARLTPDASSAPDAGWMVVSGYALLEPKARISATGALTRRAVIGCSLVAAQAAAWESAVAALDPELVVLSLAEARTLVGRDDGAIALSRALAARWGSVVVVTHPGGAAAVVAGLPVEVDAPDGPVVDTTGAGDAFAATLIAVLLADAWPASPERLEAAMLMATRHATAVAGAVGAQARVAGERDATLAP